MKYISIFVILFLYSCKKDNYDKASIIPSKIDSLSTEEQIKDYMVSIDTNYKDFNIKNISKLGLGEVCTVKPKPVPPFAIMFSFKPSVNSLKCSEL